MKVWRCKLIHLAVHYRSTLTVWLFFGVYFIDANSIGRYILPVRRKLLGAPCVDSELLQTTLLQKNGHPLNFCDYSACCWQIFKIFSNIAANKIWNNTRFKFCIDVWYLIVTQAENTPSAATVGINITQQNPTLKLVTTQFEMNAKKIRSGVKNVVH